jgi:hypothetical protein
MKQKVRPRTKPPQQRREELMDAALEESRYLKPKWLKKIVKEPDFGFPAPAPLISAPPVTSNAP